eukprot:2717596-Rhodomonas_salina.1
MNNQTATSWHKQQRECGVACLISDCTSSRKECSMKSASPPARKLRVCIRSSKRNAFPFQFQLFGDCGVFLFLIAQQEHSVRPGRVLGRDPGLVKSRNRLGSRVR